VGGELKMPPAMHTTTYHHPLKDHTMNQWLVPILFEKNYLSMTFWGENNQENGIFGL
jgi:hypothetical protein